MRRSVALSAVAVAALVAVAIAAPVAAIRCTHITWQQQRASIYMYIYKCVFT